MSNPAIYAIGKGPRTTYTNCFHDITTGNTFNDQSPLNFAACPGYDLCTGWGSPTGSNTISALAGAGTNDFTFYPSQGTVQPRRRRFGQRHHHPDAHERPDRQRHFLNHRAASRYHCDHQSREHRLLPPP